MKCPWYKEGLCYSPKTLREYGEPSSAPVTDSRCLTEKYTECPYYTEQRSSQQTQLDIIEEGAVGVKEKGLALYLRIHTIPPDMKSNCPFYEITSVRDQSGNIVYVAFCKFLDRYLTRSFVEKCIKYWKDCPYYKMHFIQET
ncbi:hypothetical protein J4526_00325 [Desulfurococcaceae archaeon MEX13E-LK6-19]|nr:hypothetical protein J4526_00325 [Desulfurococcaceae archaeon MEX13E-LK6-19]